LNFTFEKLAETIQKLDSLKSMVKDIREQKSENSTAETKGAKGSIVSVFEKGMNNDLDVKTAFDSLYDTIQGLYKMRESLSVKDVKDIMADLRRIDSVLQFIF